MKKSNLIVKSEKIDCLKKLDCIGNYNVFSSYSWIKEWVNIFKPETRNLILYAAYSQDELIAIAPFYIQKSRGFYQLKTLHPIGQGEPEISEIASEYNDIHIKEGYEEVVIQLLAKKIKELNIDQIQWRASLKNSHINRLLKEAFNYEAAVTHSRYVIERPAWSFDNLSKNTRSRYKRSINQLNKINASFKWIDKSDYEYCSEVLAQFHQTRWINKGKSGAFSEHEFNVFHQNYRNANPDNIRISALMKDNKPIAINYYIADETTLYFYQCGWDEDKYANLSPGFALHLWSIEQCPLQYYDFMMGGMNDSYKAKFGCQKIPMININITLNKLKLFFVRIFNKIN